MKPSKRQNTIISCNLPVQARSLPMRWDLFIESQLLFAEFSTPGVHGSSSCLWKLDDLHYALAAVILKHRISGIKTKIKHLDPESSTTTYAVKQLQMELSELQESLLTIVPNSQHDLQKIS